MELDYEKLLHFFILSSLTTFLLIILINNKYKKTKIILFTVSVVFYMLEALSMLTIMWDINYHFLYNLFEPTNYIVAFTTYREYAWLFIASSIPLIIVIYFINKYLKIKNNIIRYIIMLFCCIFLVTPYSLLNRFSKTIYKIIYNPSYVKSYEETFKEITGADFINKKDLTIEQSGNKNLVLIFLESFEQNFLNEKYFPNIATYINSLTKEGKFYSNIRQVEGASWTMAGIHTVLCGDPEIYSVRMNKLFKTVTISNLVCFPDVLKKDNYKQVYIGGEFKTFAGKSFFLVLHGYDEVYGDKEIFNEIKVDDKDKWSWGAKDKEVFEVAKRKYLELSKDNKKFNLTISTIAPHSPVGIYDSRCKNENENSILNAVQCDDDLIKDFIEFIKKQPNYKDTIIVLVPDHLIMSSNISDKLDEIGNRRLYSIILNTGEVKEYDDKILRTDLARIILNDLGVRSNVQFLLEKRENKTTEERKAFIDNNIEKIRSFNNKTIGQE